jgi:mono/diheme cytochrome c family protein
MKKRTFVIFGIYAVIFGLLIPYWALNQEGKESASPAAVAASDEDAKLLFQQNCGACHTLARAGTDGIVGPNLDEQLGEAETPEAVESATERVSTAIEDGVQGRMPAGILQGRDAKEVASFVARLAGR